MFWLSVGLLLGLSAVKAAIVKQDWSLSSAHISPDGFTRGVAVINGGFPGPLLTASKEDSITVNLNNRLTDPTMRRSTSIHWHGLFQHRNAYDDGPSFVTQCPISPGQSYPYNLELGDQAGTFWYHSHLGSQYVDGIRGPLVVYDPNDPYKADYDIDDSSTVITLADWYHTPAESLLASWKSGGPEPIPDSGLINGVGRYARGEPTRRARINVTENKRYRFRVISLSARGNFEFAIANHSMTIIEADGVLHEPHIVDTMTVLPGQRYSVIVNANQSTENYWIRATQTIGGSTTSPMNPNFNGVDTFAVLHYNGASDAEPTAPQPTSRSPNDIVFAEFNLKPLSNPGAPGGPSEPDRTLDFRFQTPAAGNWSINGTQYTSPSIPTLLNVLANGFTNESQFPPNQVTYVLEPNSVIEVNFLSGGGHPLHLHGHAFDVIQSASGGAVNFVNPPRRDVVGTPARIRFRTDNAGPWFLHCHNDWHMTAGLAAVFVEDPKGIRMGPQSVQPSAEWDRLCSIYNALDPDEQ